MSIQFTKVTWYSKLGAVIVLIITIFIVWYFVTEFKAISNMRQVALSPTSPIVVNGNVALSVGNSVTIDGLQITLDEVTKDSRCAIEVKCIQAGTATAHVTMQSAGKTAEADLVSDAAIYRFANYAVSMVRVAPIKHSGVDIDPNNYIVVFHVLNVLGS